MSGFTYIVVCRLREGGTVRVVGPFDNQDAALNWAFSMRQANRLWDYQPDICLEPAATLPGHRGGAR